MPILATASIRSLIMRILSTKESIFLKFSPVPSIQTITEPTLLRRKASRVL